MSTDKQVHNNGIQVEKSVSSIDDASKGVFVQRVVVVSSKSDNNRVGLQY